MTFNDNARSGGPRASKRGRNTGIAVGGGGVGLIVVFLVSQFLGVDLSGLVGGGTSAAPTGPDGTVANCETGADANESSECRIDFGAQSIEQFWQEELGSAYVKPGLVIFPEAVNTACGSATSASGPFYCPGDQTIYIDPTFYEELRSKFGAQGGPLAELYVIAHEWGHHIQHLSGTMESLDRSESGPSSDSVRLELQADCFAGAWAGAATETVDENGTPFLEPLTREQVADALNAAAAIGDDRIQERMGGEVDPHTWSHGSGEQRQKWFEQGYSEGPSSCDTFAVAKP